MNSAEVSVDSVIDLISNTMKDCNHGNTSCEFMVHPGNITEQEGGCGCGPDDFSQSCDRENEVNFLCDNKLENFIVKSNITLVNFEMLFSRKTNNLQKWF